MEYLMPISSRASDLISAVESETKPESAVLAGVGVGVDEI